MTDPRTELAQARAFQLRLAEHLAAASEVLSHLAERKGEAVSANSSGYAVKPLVWASHKDHDGNDYWHADTVFGGLSVERKQYAGWEWSYCFGEYHDEDSHACDSAEDGKRQAEAYYLSRLLPALEPADALEQP